MPKKYKVPEHVKVRSTDVILIVGLFMLIYFVGIFVFHIVEGWSFLDSAYFVTATVTTIGYGDIVPKTDTGKLLTIVFAWLGVSTAFYLIFKISEWRKRNFDELFLQKMASAFHKRK